MSSYARRRARVPSRQQEAGSRERGVASGTQLGGARGVLFLLGQSTPHISDRKSTRLNSSHDQISYAVFCLKKKKKPEDVCPHRKNPTINGGQGQTCSLDACCGKNQYSHSLPTKPQTVRSVVRCAVPLRQL